MKEELCAALCHELKVIAVPAGLAVGTAFQKSDSDHISFYMIGPDESGMYRVQDDGATIPYLEACGADLGIPARAEAFNEILEEYGITYDEDTFEIVTDPIPRNKVPKAGLRLVAALLRLQDLLLMMRERAERTWVDEVKRDLEQQAALRNFSIRYDAVISPALSDYPADAVLEAANRAPVAVFWGVNDAKVYEALLLQAGARYEARTDVVVVVVLEKDNSVSKKARNRADNHIIVPRYREHERDAVARVVEVATGKRPQVIH
jgi:hypothetical protein